MKFWPLREVAFSLGQACFCKPCGKRLGIRRLNLPADDVLSVTFSNKYYNFYVSPAALRVTDCGKPHRTLSGTPMPSSIIDRRIGRRMSVQDYQSRRPTRRTQHGTHFPRGCCVQRLRHAFQIAERSFRLWAAELRSFTANANVRPGLRPSE